MDEFRFPESRNIALSLPGVAHVTRPCDRPRDRLAAFDRLQSMVEEIKGQSVPEDESAAGYLGSTPHWLQGPKTVTVEMGDGGKVTVETGSTPDVIEGRAETL